MKVLVLYAHPVGSSFGSVLHRQAIAGLEIAGHDVDDCHLYAEGFDPVMSERDRMRYYEIPENRNSVEKYVRRLEATNALVIVSPVWTLGFPAILKGYFDRVWLPGVSFVLKSGKVVPNLANITKLAAVTTYGGSWLQTALLGDPPRTTITRLVRGQIVSRPPVQYLAHYGMDTSTELSRKKFIEKVRARLSEF